MQKHINSAVIFNLRPCSLLVQYFPNFACSLVHCFSFVVRTVELAINTNSKVIMACAMDPKKLIKALHIVGT